LKRPVGSSRTMHTGIGIGAGQGHSDQRIDKNF
jgi:hypothetical protein